MISAIFIWANAGAAEHNTRARAETNAGTVFTKRISLSRPDGIFV